jgi:hypothetical protein
MSHGSLHGSVKLARFPAQFNTHLLNTLKISGPMLVIKILQLTKLLGVVP